MRNWKSYSMAAVFVALYSFSLVGCDPSATIADILADILTGGSGCGAGCGGCGDCSSCSSCDCGCDCSGCDDCGSCDCNIGCDPTLREHPTRAEFTAGTPGRAQGFHGPNVHPNRRIANAVQLRLGASGYSFLEQQIPGLIGSFLGAGGFPIPGDFGPNGQSPGKVYIELRQFSLDPAINCTSSNPSFPGLHDCIRATMYAYFRTCDNNGTCTSAENVPLSIPVNTAGIGTLTCNLNLDAGRGAATNGLRITAADVTTVPEVAGFAARANFSRIAVLDAQVDQNTLEGADVVVTCPNIPNSLALGAACALGFLIQGVTIDCTDCSGFLCIPCTAGTCDIDPSGIVNNTINQLRGDINNIIDFQLADKMPTLCQAAFRDRDCPTGTTYAAPATAGQPGSCTINGQNRCMELLLGMEGRVDIGGAVSVVTPGIEAMLDFIGAFQGHGRTVGLGSNAYMYLGLEGWLADNVMFAGLRAMPHNPCVAIEHPANNQTDCDNVGSGWEYEQLANGAFSGRCVPRIPVVPESDVLKRDAPDEINVASADGDFEMAAGVSESFVHYAAWKLWDSGALCLGVGSWLDPTLAPSLISFAFLTGESKQRLFFPLSVDANIDPYASPESANVRSSVALALRPQQPPAVSIDEVDDPCEPGSDKRLQIDIQMPKLDLDLSIWSQDRWARGGTIETDTHIVIELDLGPQTSVVNGCRQMQSGDIDLAIKTIGFDNSRYLPDAPNLSPAEFRRDPLTNLYPVEGGMRTISSLAGGIATPLLGGLTSLNIEETINDLLLGTPTAPSTLPLAVPFGVRIDPDALQVVEQTNAPCSGPPFDMGVRGVDNNCTSSFMAIYADLVPAAQANTSANLRGTVETSVQVTNVTRPANSPSYDMQGPSFGEGEQPMVEFRMGATGPANAEFEYRYRTTLSPWSEWSRSNYGVIRDRALFVQGRHEVYAQARIAGDNESRDRQSARAPFVIDVTPPMLEVYAGANGGAQLHTMDLVSGHLEYRTQEPGDDFGAWTAVPSNGIVDLDVDAGTLIEVRDEDGNVGSNVASLQGRTSSATSSACGSCATVGNDSTRGSSLALVSMAALGVVVARRRRRAA